MSTTRRIEVAPNTELFTELWTPDADPRFGVIISHGQGEYISRYDQIAGELNAAGAIVMGPDHRGQGRSSGPMGYIESFSDYASDMRRVVDTLTGELPETQRPGKLPYFLWGHSMGGVVATIFALDQRDFPLTGLIVSNPMLKPSAKGAGVKQVLGKVLSKITPKLPIPINLDRSLLFRDKERLAEYEKDQTGFDPLTPMFGEAWAAAVKRVYAETGTIDIPMLWCVGTGDRIIAPQPTIDHFRGVPGTADKDQSLEIFEGYYHEIHNEPPAERQVFVDKLIEWTTSRL